MKFVCFGYFDESRWGNMTGKEQNGFIDRCLAYDDLLRENGHIVGGEALENTRNAATVRYRNGKVSVTDGPYAETKEQIGGIMLLEANDLNHAAALLSNHPSILMGGCFEIRTAADITAMIAESERRRSAMA
jgi:hypothetical protein